MLTQSDIVRVKHATGTCGRVWKPAPSRHSVVSRSTRQAREKLACKADADRLNETSFSRTAEPPGLIRQFYTLRRADETQLDPERVGRSGVSGLGSGEMFSAVVPELSKGREVTEPQISFAFHLVIQESE